MSASKMSQKGPAKEETLSNFAKNFLMRPMKVAQTECTGLTPDADGQCTFMAYTFTGIFSVEESTWRVLGMRPRHMEAGSIVEYDVVQMPQKWKVDGTEAEEKLPFSKREQVLRVCLGDSLHECDAFRQEREILKSLRLECSGNKRFYDQLPRFFGESEFSSLKGGSFERAPSWSITPKIPKPFFIYENVGPSLEVFRRSQRSEKISPYCAVFLVIACVNSLRLAHDAGYVIRDVQPSNFSLRLGPSGKLNRREADICNRVALTNFSMAVPFRRQSVRRESSCGGTRKYCSSAAMRFEPASPTDDLISCCYMLQEFLTGSLPWSKPNISFRQILQEKEKAEAQVNITFLTAVGKPPTTYFENISHVYQEIKKGNGFDALVNYQEVVRRLAVGVESWKDVEKDQSIFAYQRPVILSYRHGTQMKNPSLNKPDPDAKTAETEEMALKADCVFPSTGPKEKENKVPDKEADPKDSSEKNPKGCEQKKTSEKKVCEKKTGDRKKSSEKKAGDHKKT